MQEKNKLLAGIEQRASELAKEEEGQRAMRQKISAMESKLLSGGLNIVDQTNEQQQTLDARRRQLAEQRVRTRTRTPIIGPLGLGRPLIGPSIVSASRTGDAAGAGDAGREHGRSQRHVRVAAAGGRAEDEETQKGTELTTDKCRLFTDGMGSPSKL